MIGSRSSLLVLAVVGAGCKLTASSKEQGNEASGSASFRDGPASAPPMDEDAYEYGSVFASTYDKEDSSPPARASEAAAARSDGDGTDPQRRQAAVEVDEILLASGLAAPDRSSASTLLGNSNELASVLPRLTHVSERLLHSGCTSTVDFRTSKSGALIHYVPIGRRKVTTGLVPTNETNETLPIGIYHVWTERAGKVTSEKANIFRILRSQERVQVVENE